LIAPCDICVLPFATQIKNAMALPPATDLAFELKLIFCVQGVMAPPRSHMRRSIGEPARACSLGAQRPT
jgi:hypothetical protein